MSLNIIDGKAIAARLRMKIAEQVCSASRRGWVPSLAVILVGNDPASEVYVRSKLKITGEVGMRSYEHRLPADTTQQKLLSLIGSLNCDDNIDGILVQLPLPQQIDAQKILQAIDPAKDVDGFHPINAGLVATGGIGLVPCTPLGCIKLIKTVRKDLTGLDAVVIGKSNIVGKPVALLLMQEGCTVTVVHLESRNVPMIVVRADIVVVAAGSPELVRGDWVKRGAIVIDVGINRVQTPDGKSRLVGDVAFDEVASRSLAITPVPGGVGPMTIACLLNNTMAAAAARRRDQNIEVRQL